MRSQRWCLILTNARSYAQHKENKSFPIHAPKKRSVFSWPPFFLDDCLLDTVALYVFFPSVSFPSQPVSLLHCLKCFTTFPRTTFTVPQNRQKHAWAYPAIVYILEQILIVTVKVLMVVTAGGPWYVKAKTLLSITQDSAPLGFVLHQGPPRPLWGKNLIFCLCSSIEDFFLLAASKVSARRWV